MQKLFNPVQMGSLQLKNRIVMAPLTRQRCPDRVPHDLTAEYYAQRASAGLIVSEATSISEQGTGYDDTPCIYTAEQAKGWKKVTEAVHAKGGKIVCQLWHVGRISHPGFHGGEASVAPSAIKATGHIKYKWKQHDFEMPRALESSEIPGIIQQYAKASKLALEAGFDGIEIHAANGYLLEEFLKDNSNHRTDMYGGSIENRCRLLMDVLDECMALWPTGSVGLRLSPSGHVGGIDDSDPESLYEYLLAALPNRKMAYIHFVDEMPHDIEAGAKTIPSYWLRSECKAKMILCGNQTRETALEAVANGLTDAVAFGKEFISNPDLVERLQANAPLNQWDSKTFYGGGAEGYTDYPRME